MSALVLATAAGPRSSFEMPWLEGGWSALVKASLPVAVYLAALPILWLVFRGSWRTLDAEATDRRQEMRLSGRHDARPLALFAITALVLTAQEYYGSTRFYGVYIRPLLRDIELGKAARVLGDWVDTQRYGELYGYAWWAVTRVVGYTFLPLAAWKLLFRKDSLLDMGLRGRGFARHAWMYAVCLALVLPFVLLAAQWSDFSSYYPFYKQCSRSWLDLCAWEALYIAQFFALEVFFRGFMLVPLRSSMGASAIVVMCVPYVMIHYGKPYLEAANALIAGVVLGSLAMRARSIYGGFLVHIAVALVMDGLALAAADGLPKALVPLDEAASGLVRVVERSLVRAR
jgi:membrane protease YdiL (CAAX protease family)